MFRVKRILIAVFAVLAILYAVDYVAARQRPRGSMRVDRLYTSTDKWNAVVWSRGDPVMESCVNSLLPHFGLKPCWYLTRHQMSVTNTD